MAVASAGPHANHLHLAPERQPRQYPTTQFLQAGFPSCRPTNSIKALKANALKEGKYCPAFSTALKEGLKLYVWTNKPTNFPGSEIMPEFTLMVNLQHSLTVVYS